MRPKTFDQDQALEAAMLQFWDSGFEGTSMQNLVDCMGISRQSLYDTFGNKRDLFESALNQYIEQVIGPKVRAMTDPQVAPGQAIHDHLEAAAHGASGMPAGCLMVRTATEIPTDDARIAEFLDGCVRKVKQALIEVIERGQASGEFDASRTADDLACSVIATSMGLQVLRRLPYNGKEYRPTIDALMAGLGLSPTSH